MNFKVERQNDLYRNFFVILLELRDERHWKSAFLDFPVFVTYMAYMHSVFQENNCHQSRQRHRFRFNCNCRLIFTTSDLVRISTSWLATRTQSSMSPSTTGILRWVTFGLSNITWTQPAQAATNCTYSTFSLFQSKHACSVYIRKPSYRLITLYSLNRSGQQQWHCKLTLENVSARFSKQHGFGAWFFLSSVLKSVYRHLWMGSS